jgi:23S rRNA pseudouridine2605 synthase
VKERIQKILAAAGVGSRRGVEEMVRQGRVTVNGITSTELPILVDAEQDRVTVDGEFIKLRRQREHRLYILLHKPKRVYSTNVAQGEQLRAIDLLPPGFTGRVYPVGRLDAESKGLLLLTNDGELTQRLTHPRYGVPKTYRAAVDGFLDDKTLAKSGLSGVKLIKRWREKSLIEITLSEGPNREVRRVLAKLGHKVRELTRVRMGPLTLDGLEPGESRPLTSYEIKRLREWTNAPT